MTRSSFIKYLLIGILVAIVVAALADALGFYNTKPYTVVPHGSHNHYVPHNRNPEVPIHRFPTEPPQPGEKITPNGQVIPVDSIILNSEDK